MLFIRGDTLIICFLFHIVLHCLLIYIYEDIHDICLVVNAYVKSRIYFVLLVFSTRVYAFVECFRNIQVDSVVLLSTLAINR